MSEISDSRPSKAAAANPNHPDGAVVALRVHPLTGALYVMPIGVGGGGTSMVDKSAFAVGVDAVTPGAGVYKAARLTLADGEEGAVALNAKRAQFVTPENSASAELFTITTPGEVTITNPVVLVTQIPATSGGLLVSRKLSTADTTGINAKASAGQIYGWVITNTNAAARFVKLYNKATAPTVGADTPIATLCIPGNATGSGMVAAEFTSGIACSLGIGYGITTGVADADTGAPAANEVIVNLFYK